jgi:hypothetical protein
MAPKLRPPPSFSALLHSSCFTVQSNLAGSHSFRRLLHHTPSLESFRRQRYSNLPGLPIPSSALLPACLPYVFRRVWSTLLLTSIADFLPPAGSFSN